MGNLPILPFHQNQLQMQSRAGRADGGEQHGRQLKDEGGQLMKMTTYKRTLPEAQRTQDIDSIT